MGTRVEEDFHGKERRVIMDIVWQGVMLKLHDRQDSWEYALMREKPSKNIGPQTVQLIRKNAVTKKSHPDSSRLGQLVCNAPARRSAGKDAAAQERALEGAVAVDAATAKTGRLACRV